MSNYIQIISQQYPDVRVSATDGCDYDTINWGDETVIPQATLDDEVLVMYKTQYITDMSALAQADIVDGFESSALGTSYWYDSKAEDQLNLIGAGAAGDTMNYSCRETQNGSKSYLSHTNAELVQVIQDGRDVKLNILQTFNTNKELILAATTISEVDAIVW